MNNFTDLIDRYIAIWNGTDAERRRALIAQTWTENASYLDPVMNDEGHAGIAAMIQQVQEKFPGHLFRRSSDVDAHNNRVHFAWELAPESGAAVICGTDLGDVAPDGCLQTITGFLTTHQRRKPNSKKGGSGLSVWRFGRL